MASRNRVVEGSGNVFADLGYLDAEEHQTKAKLVSRIAKRIERQNLTQKEAAGKLGIDQPKISAMLAGRFRGFSVYRLMRFVADLGIEVEIVTKDHCQKPPKVDEIPVHSGIVYGRRALLACPAVSSTPNPASADKPAVAPGTRQRHAAKAVK